VRQPYFPWAALCEMEANWQIPIIFKAKVKNKSWNYVFSLLPYLKKRCQNISSSLESKVQK
jgi:hypothetical protein